jgi:hypothetical protein
MAAQSRLPVRGKRTKDPNGVKPTRAILSELLPKPFAPRGDQPCYRYSAELLFAPPY